MANRKLSDHTAITGANVNAAADYIEILDVSDTTDAASGTNKKILPSQLLIAIGAEPAKGADDNYVTDAEKVVIGNTSGTNTGDQNLSGYLLSSTAATTYEPKKGSDDNFVTDAQLVVISNTSGTNTGDNATNSQYSGLAGQIAAITYPIQVKATGAGLAISAGTAKTTFRMPYAMTVTAVRASLTTAQTSGNIFTVDINDGGTSILSTKLTIDNGEKTSTTAATPAVISDTALADDAEITIDVDQIGDGTAVELLVTIIGTR